MGLFEQFPYTNFHGLNLDWLLKKMEELAKEMGDLSTYVRSFIDTQIEPLIEAKLDEMVADGELDEILARMEVIDYVTPEMFGAKGDGLTDDTEAFQRAVNSGRAVCLLMGSMYKLTETIHLSNLHTETETRERVNRIIFQKAPTDYNSPSPAIVCEISDNTHPIFAIEAPNWRMVNVTAQCKNGPGNDAPEDLTFIKTNMSDPNVDFAMIGCKIDRANVIADVTGRGFLMRECLAFRPHKILAIKWAGDPEEGTYHGDLYGQRAIILENNRFHSCTGGPMITLAAAANAVGFRFCNNIFDRGHAEFMSCSGRPLAWKISGNTINGMKGLGGDTNPLIRFLAGAEDVMITDNMIHQIPQANEGSFAHLLDIAPTEETVKSLVVANNNVNKMSDGGLVIVRRVEGGITSPVLTGCGISGNVIEALDSTDETVRAVVKGMNLKMEQCVITDNVVGSHTGTASIYTVYSSGTHRLLYSKVIGNVIPGSAVTYAGTGDATLTGTLIDDTLIPSGNDSDERI